MPESIFPLLVFDFGMPGACITAAPNSIVYLGDKKSEMLPNSSRSNHQSATEKST